MLNRQALLFLGIAVLLGLAAAFAARSWLQSQVSGAPVAQVETAPVVIARVAVAVGTALSGRELELVQWPSKYLPSGPLSSIEAASGRVVRRPVARGEPVLETALLPEGSEAGLVAVIDKDKRAISVKVDAVIGVAGFVKPGARVDVVATLRRINAKDKLPYSKIILQDVRVLAIDQQLEEAEDGEAVVVNVVTLEVEPKQAEALTYISHEGRVQLALRNPGDHDIIKTRSTGVADLLPARSHRRSSGPRTQVQVIQGSKVSTKNF